MNMIDVLLFFQGGDFGTFNAEFTHIPMLYRLSSCQQRFNLMVAYDRK